MIKHDFPLLKYVIRCCIRLWLMTLCLPCIISAQGVREPELTIQQQTEDVHYLKTKLQSWHPNLDLNVPQGIVEQYLDLVVSTSSPQKSSAFYARISAISGMICDGHLTFLPSPKLLATTDNKVLPLHILYLGEELIIDQVYRSNPSIPIGSRILSINKLSGLPSMLLARLPTDGKNFNYASWILNRYFSSYYSFSYGHPQTFIIESTNKGIERMDTLQSMTWDSITHYKKNNQQPLPEKGIEFNLNENQHYAILKIRDFHPQVLHKKYHQDFRKELKAAFDNLKLKGISNLILDLRDNQGGNLSYGKMLLSYLIDHPFTMIEAYYKRDDKADLSIQKTNGPCSGNLQPLANGFGGQAYVLINGGSFSNSAIVASCLKRNSNSIFLGEETGGNRQVMGGFTRKITLPNSKIKVEIPMRRIVLEATKSYVGEGVKPDHEVKPTLQEVIAGEDPVLEAAIKLIKSK